MRWTADTYSLADAAGLEDALGLSPAAAQILARRGITTPQAAQAFIAAKERHPGSELPGATEAVATILRHVEARSPIVVFGDYDVDGVCATAIMLESLRALGADPAYRLPSRQEGYGLSVAAVEELHARGAALIITVDCGITAVPEVARASELGVDVVVTDHHRPGPELPECPIAHPALGDYGSPDLCGAAVALKLGEALRAAAGLDPAGAEAEALDLAGLATVCDMVPLRGENRRLARSGLTELARARRPGIAALMEVAQLEAADCDARSAAFRLGPRLNAAGRLGRADAALELVLTQDRERGTEIAKELDGLNHDRREAERLITSEAQRQAEAQVHQAAIVVAGEGWHHGVVGIVASRLVERHRRPCVVIGLDDGRGRGSGRSIEAYDLHAGLQACDEHLARHGGHKMAAGLELDAGAVPAFRAALAAHAGALLTPSDLIPPLTVDAIVPPSALNLGLAEELERLGPYGASNPAPVLLAPAARIEGVTAMGADREHSRFTLTGGGARVRGVAFRVRQGALAEQGGRPRDVAVSLERNRWNGAVEARVVLERTLEPEAGSVIEIGPSPEPAATDPDGPKRTVRDRRHEGFAGVAGSVLSAGDPALIVVADVARRRAGLEATMGRTVAVAEWDTIAADPAAAAPFDTLVLLDPPPRREDLDLPGAGSAHMAWTNAELEFAQLAYRARLDLRSALEALYRELRDRGELPVDSLRGTGEYPHPPVVQQRLLSLLTDLGLAALTEDGRITPLPGNGVALEETPTARRLASDLRATERWLASDRSTGGAITASL